MKKFLTYLITILLFIIVGFHIYAGAIDVGMKLRETSEYLEIFFYASVIIVVYFLILQPLLKVLFSPSYSIAKYCDEKNTSNLKSRAKRLLKYGNLDEENKEMLENAMDDNEKLAKRMYIIYNNIIKKNIDDIVVNCSRDTLVITGFSQSHFVDMLTVLVNNFRMVKKIVTMCGFRPTFIRTLKLYIVVFNSSLIADGAQKMEVTSLISTSLQGSLKLVADSAVNGAINAFFMLRVGMLTKNYLYAKDTKKMKVSIRDNSFVDAIKLFPSVVSSLITTPIKGVTNLFKGKEKTNEEVEVSEELQKVEWKRKPFFFK